MAAADCVSHSMISISDAFINCCTQFFMMRIPFLTVLFLCMAACIASARLYVVANSKQTLKLSVMPCGFLRTCTMCRSYEREHAGVSAL